MANAKAPTPGVAGEHAPDQRRSFRLHFCISVLVRGVLDTHPFQEETHTITLSAHGCMVLLAAQVARGQEVSIVNPRTAEELPCTVITLGPTDGGKREIGLEFSEPSPVFWGIVFPPEDWDPAERKLPPPVHPFSTTRR